MNVNHSDNKPVFSDFIFLLFRWKRFIIINLLFAIIISAGISLLIPNTYRSSVTVIIAPESSGGGIGSIANLLSGSNPLLSFGAKLLGGDVTQEDMLLGILNSRTVLSNAIEKFNLFEYYKIKNANIDRTIRNFKNDLSFDPTEFGFIEICVTNKNRILCADIANHMINMADSIHIALNIENARRNRLFIENRYIQNVTDLAAAEESLYEFQKKHGVFMVPEQIKLAINAAGEIEAELIKNEIMLHTLENQVSPHSALYQNTEMQIKAILKKLEGIHKEMRDDTSVLIPFEKMPLLEKEYLRHYREVEIQNRLLQFTYTLYEQARMEEQKNIPTVMILDSAVPPHLKHSPKRAVIVVAVVFLVFIFNIFICLRGQYLLISALKNPVEEFERESLKKMLKLYSVDIDRLT